MKSFLTLFSVTVICSTLLFSSCKKKSDDPTPDTRSNTEKLVGHAYRLTAATVKYNETESDVYSQADACVKDNTTTFNSDHTTTDDEGATKCDPSDSQVTNGTWLFTNSESELTVEGETYTILTNDGNTLKLQKSSVSGGVTYVTTFTMSKI